MENSEYNNLVYNHEYEKLANINNIEDLIDYKYLKRYLIEYLLEEGIHTTIMDTRAKYSIKWTKFYLKYNITKPLLNCQLGVLLDDIDGQLVFDILLEKLDDVDKMQLLANIKKDSYWNVREHEQDIIRIYRKHGIILPQTFISLPSIFDNTVSERKKDDELLSDFCRAYHNTNPRVLAIYLHELKRRLGIDHKRVRNDIEKLIEHKEKNQDFSLEISTDTEGVYDSETNTITISPSHQGVLTHELSHMLYNEFEYPNDSYLKYELIREEINNPKTIDKITNYLKVFHERFNNMQNYFIELYYHEIDKKYGGFNKYIDFLCRDISEVNPDIITANDDKLYFYVDEDSIYDIANELIVIEKNEFATVYTRNYYAEELMLENLLDALLKGTICDGKLDIECLSGHISRDFMEDGELSFNECLADYDAIKNSRKSSRLIKDLEVLVGSELIDFLDNYLEINRGVKYGI